jgi:chaperonin GroES
MKPNKNMVLIKEAIQERVTDSGIVLSETAVLNKPQKGEVVAIGKMDETPEFKVGDTVIYKKWGGNEYVVDKINYLFVSPEDILGIE